MKLNDYAKKSSKYSQYKKNEGTIMIAYNELNSIIEKHVSPKTKKALDFGCGTGYSRIFLESIGFDAFGVDIDPNMISKAKELDNDKENKYALIINSLPFLNCKFDLVFSSLVVLEMESKEEIFNYFLEAQRVLRFDGIFIVLTVNDNFYKHQWASVDTSYPGNSTAKSGDKVRIKLKEIDLELDDYYWTKQDYREISQKAGLTIIDEIEPQGRSDDGIEWLSETNHAPFVIFVMKKSLSLKRKNELSKELNLQVCIPERGNFTEVFRDPEIIKKEDLPGYSGDRNAKATIKLLMSERDFWPFHRQKSRETFKYIEGKDLIIHCIENSGKYIKVYVGKEHENAVEQFTIPSGTWFSEEVSGQSGYCLVESTTSPGFHPDDVEEAKLEDMLLLVGQENSDIAALVQRLSTK